MSRYRPLLLGALLTVTAGTVLTGMPIGLVAVAAASIAVGGIPLLFRRAVTPEGSWTPPLPALVDPAPAGPLHEPHTPSSSRAVVGAIEECGDPRA